ncbi:MAG: flagellar basal body rod protein FlgC [Oscillospiraceae bacterium]|nr:flagellar basal body rod protein FlgC [Oscillospiraceae bacterium]
MAFLSSLNITGSALTAERFRMDIIAQNVANIDTTMTEEGTPYRRKQVVFEERSFKSALQSEQTKLSSGGVRVAEVVESQEDFVPVYDPDHPHADENGYVLTPNVDRAEEYVDMMAASSAYNANITVLNVVKSMTMKALEIGK